MTVPGSGDADTSARDASWETCRNSLAIARLLAHERRSDAYVATAAALAVENACRAALAQLGLSFDGDVLRGWERLAAPREIFPADPGATGLDLVAAAERVVAWVSDLLRNEAPDRAWGF